MDIGTRIKKERERKGWTQEELARRCGYKYKSSISKIESSGNEITSKKVQLVADALGVSVGYLMGWDAYGNATRRTLGESAQNFSDLNIEKEEADFFNELHSRPEMKMLFKSAKGATKEQIESVARMLESFKQE